MEFRNLTAFDALAFKARIPDGRPYRVFVMKVGYRLRRSDDGTWAADVIDDEPVPLTLVDAYWGDHGASSLREESDLVPYKPRCDVVLNGTAHAPNGEPHREWLVALRVGNDSETLIDKVLEVRGPSTFRRGAVLPGWKHTRPHPATQVPLRWESTFGGRSVVPDPRDPADLSLNEVCFANPVGTGWMERRHIRFARRAGVEEPWEIPAPQIAYPGQQLQQPVRTRHPDEELDAAAMARIADGYPRQPAGFGPVGKAWAPRLKLAGTYDEQWLQEQSPNLPKDFSFSYWNGAPQDQQCPHLAPGIRIETWNLCDPSLTPRGYLSVRLPEHRPYVLVRLKSGLKLNVPMQTDTVSVDTDAMRITLTHRASISEDELPTRVAEARLSNKSATPA